jgi:serine/threonine protein kinase
VVTVFDYFEDGGLAYIAMEHVAGGSLRPFVCGRSLAEAGGVLEGILAGLGHAHEAGVIHCDLKPENVLVTADGRVKIADFGIARAADVARDWDGTGRPTGTLAYMAPEMVARRPIDHRVDLWSRLRATAIAECRSTGGKG